MACYTGKGEHHGRQVSEVERAIAKAGRGGQGSEEGRHGGKGQRVGCKRGQEDEVAIRPCGSRGISRTDFGSGATRANVGIRS